MRLSTSLLIAAAALAACQGNFGDANDNPSSTDTHGGSGADGGGIGTTDGGGGDADAPLAPVKPPAPVTPPSDDPNAPKVFNHSSSLRGGEVISIQGENLADAEVWLQGATPQKLPIMNHGVTA